MSTKFINFYKDGTTVIMMIVIRIFLRISYDFVGDFGYDHTAIIKMLIRVRGRARWTFL